MIPYGKQSINEADIAAVVAALRSDYLTTGPLVAEFEQGFASRVGAKHAVAVSSATAALHLAMVVADIGPGDRVITSPNTFLSSANAAAFVGAIPDFADICPVSYNLDPASLEANWQSDIRAVVAVDYAGQSAEMPAIAEISRRNGAVVIEDASHAVGGKFHFDGKVWSIGGHPWADMTVFSFHPVKTMTTGEGGMLVTDDDEFAASARRLRAHGVTRCADDFQGLGGAGLDEFGPWYYEMHDLGFNYRITDLQCALGLSQLDRLEHFVKRRREIVGLYNDAFVDLSEVGLPALRAEIDRGLTSWHLYSLQVDFARLKVSRSVVMKRLRAQGVGSQVLYIPVHLQPWYRKMYSYGPGKCPVAESYYQKTLSLPLYPDMADVECERVVEAVLKIFLGL